MDHTQNSHGTVSCPTEGVRADADREGGVLVCSACGSEVEPFQVNRMAETI